MTATKSPAQTWPEIESAFSEVARTPLDRTAEVVVREGVVMGEEMVDVRLWLTDREEWGQGLTLTALAWKALR